MVKVTIAIPTYWTWGMGKSIPSGDTIYDHPTPLDQSGTLARLLESLKVIDYSDFNIVVLTAATNSSLVKAAASKVNGIIERFNDSFQIMQFAPHNLKILHQHLKKLDLGDHIIQISLCGYPNVRNVQLIITHVLGSDVMVGLDDDEIVTDKGYLNKAVEFIGKEKDGNFVGGVAGLYLDRQGNYELSEKERCRKEKESNLFIRKEVIMDDAILSLERNSNRLVETPFVFGGNMVIHRNVFEKVAFDPYITRGEDVDYLINGRMLGCHFFLDKDLQIVHLPPKPTPCTDYFKLKQDVIRFIYERYKISIAKAYLGFKAIAPEELDPYPGCFLRKNVENHALEALNWVRPGDIGETLSLEEFVAAANQYAQQVAHKYFRFQKEWGKIMKIIKRDTGIRKYLMSLMLS